MSCKYKISSPVKAPEVQHSAQLAQQQRQQRIESRKRWFKNLKFRLLLKDQIDGDRDRERERATKKTQKIPDRRGGRLHVYAVWVTDADTLFILSLN